MKKILSILFCSSIAVSGVFAQNTFPPTGNAGIGTLTPQASLDVIKSYNAIQNKSLKMFYNGSWGTESYASDFRFLDIESSEGGKILQLNGYGMGIGYNPPAYASADKLYVNGNVGIGTVNPGYKLDVQGGTVNVNLDNISALGGQLTISNGYGNQDGAVRLNLNNGGAVSWIKGLVTGPNTNTGSAIVFGVPSETTDGIERMRITSSGDVGIGTADPKGYKLAVNGKIRAQEIKVEASPWPDYVFKKDYKLPSLQQTEQHIKEKGHLPGIPSGAEVEASGLDLGEMNSKLLQKIEELTLHLIEKDKQLSKQQLSIDQQESRLKKLENFLKL